MHYIYNKYINFILQMKSKYFGIFLLLLSIILAIFINEFILYYKQIGIKKIQEKYTERLNIPPELQTQQTQHYNNRQ